MKKIKNHVVTTMVMITLLSILTSCNNNLKANAENTNETQVESTEAAQSDNMNNALSENDKEIINKFNCAISLLHRVFARRVFSHI